MTHLLLTDDEEGYIGSKYFWTFKEGGGTLTGL